MKDCVARIYALNNASGQQWRLREQLVCLYDEFKNHSNATIGPCDTDAHVHNWAQWAEQ